MKDSEADRRIEEMDIKTFATELLRAIQAAAFKQAPLLLTRKATAEYLGIGLTTLTLWCATRPGFPQPIRPSGRGKDPYWKRKDLEAWVERMK